MKEVKMKLLLQTLFCFILLAQFCFGQWVQTEDIIYDPVQTLVVKDSNLFAGTRGGGVLRSSNNGLDWVLVNDGLTDYWITAFAVLGDFLFTGTYGGFLGDEGGVFYTTNNGTNWTEINNGLPEYRRVTSLLAFDQKVFVGLESEGVFLSTDNGINWSDISNGITGLGEVIALTANGENVFVGAGLQGVFSTTNNGINWMSLNNGLPLYTPISALTVLGNNLFAGTCGNIVTPGRGVFLSTDNGANWSEYNYGLPTLNCSVLSFTISNTNIFVGTYWDDTTAIVPGGVFLSTEGNSSWTDVSEGLNVNYIPSLAASDFYIFAGTQSWVGTGTGVWRRPLSEVTTVEENLIEVPSSYILSQNYPNPFNPSTKIKYSIPQTSQVQIKVFDVLGNEIETLVNEEKQMGTYELTWNAANLPSGVYFYQLKASSFVETKKMILIK